jgi:cytoskeletal protein RodZ
MNERTIGESLKQAREQKGKTLSDIARVTQIKFAFLEALERGDFTYLPQPYIRLHLRTYAEQVGIDPDEILRRYDTTTVTSAPRYEVPRTFHPIRPRVRFPWGRFAVVGGGIVILLLAVVLYYRFPNRIASSSMRPALFPSSPDTPQVGLVSSGLGEGEAVDTVFRAPVDTVSERMSSPAPTLDTLAAERIATLQAGSGDTVSSDDIVVEVEAKAQVWMEVYTAKDTLFYDLLEGGERRTWRDPTGLEVKVGNWVNAVLTISGKPVRGIPRIPQVVKLVATKEGVERLPLGQGWRFHKRIP